VVQDSFKKILEPLSFPLSPTWAGVGFNSYKTRRGGDIRKPLPILLSEGGHSAPLASLFVVQIAIQLSLLLIVVLVFSDIVLCRCLKFDDSVDDLF
jgi:hypothetical protein